MAVAVSSCMAALHLACTSLGVRGKRIAIPALTHPATAHAVEMSGGIPVFVDVGEDGNLIVGNLPDVEGFFPVHFLGRPVTIDTLQVDRKENEWIIVEDCALALGSVLHGRHVGLWGDVGCFSFYPVKHITTGEGGMFVTRHPDLAEKARRQRAFGFKNGLCIELGFNYRMTEIQASIGIEQLISFPEMLSIRAINALRYKARLSEAIIGSYAVVAFLGSNEKREKVNKKLRALLVEPSIYYPVPVPLHPYYANKYGYEVGQFPNAERIANETIALPTAPHVRADEIDRICEIIEDVRNA